MAENTNQLLFDLPLQPSLGRDDFYVTETNVQGLSAIDCWPDWDNHVQIISGPPGSGKSHLGRVWQNASKAKVVTPDKVLVPDLPSLMSNAALLIEDLPGQNLDETALFHLINLAREQNGFLLLTSRLSAANWNIKLPDLASRLAMAGSARLSEPDDNLLRGIIIKQFSDRQLSVNEDIVSFMLARMERSGQAACELVAEIDKRALRQKANITKRFVSRILDI